MPEIIRARDDPLAAAAPAAELGHLAGPGRAAVVRLVWLATGGAVPSYGALVATSVEQVLALDRWR